MRLINTNHVPGSMFIAGDPEVKKTHALTFILSWWPGFSLWEMEAIRREILSNPTFPFTNPLGFYSAFPQWLGSYLSHLSPFEWWLGRFKASAYNGDLGSIPGSGRPPGEGNGNPLQYPCLENPMDGGSWSATVHGVAKSQTGLRDFTFTFTLHLNTGFQPLLIAWRHLFTEHPLYSASPIFLCSEVTYDFSIAKSSGQFSVILVGWFTASNTMGSSFLLETLMDPLSLDSLHASVGAPLSFIYSGSSHKLNL